MVEAISVVLAGMIRAALRNILITLALANNGVRGLEVSRTT
jgi:hypothetical protein